MSAFAPNVGPAAISERILSPLRRVRGRQWIMRSSRAAMQLLLIAFTAWLAMAMLLGCFPSLPALARVGLALVAWGALGGACAVFVPPMFRKRQLSSVAQEVEQTLPQVHELLSSAVELSAIADPRFAASEELIAHLMRQAEEAAKAVQPQTIVSFRTLGYWGAYLAPIVIAWVMLSILMPITVARGLYRIVHPWDPHVPMWLAVVRVTPGDANVPQGDPLEISVDVASGFHLKPEVGHATMLATYGNGQTVSSDLSRTGPRDFHTVVDEVRQDFTYRISTDQGESQWFHVRALARPEVSGIDVRYVYPAYTHWNPKDDPRKDGAIDALIGTEAQFVIHATQGLDLRSRLVMDGKPGAEPTVPLVPVMGDNGSDYAAAFTVQKSGSYRIELINADGLTNKTDTPRSILARPDLPPKIEITAPTAPMTIPIDDTVPIDYRASDDIGLAKIEALIQIDGRAAEPFPVVFSSPDGLKTIGRWKLSLPYVLARLSIADANQVTYQLRATDNRDPNPQSTLSAKGVLKIQHATTQSYIAKEESKDAHDLIEAIKKAITELAADQKEMDPLASTGADRIFAARERMGMSALKDALMRTDKDLSDAAAENLDGPLGDVARAVQQIADNSIAGAADQMAAALLASDQPTPRGRSLAGSAQNVALAKKELEALLPLLQKDAKQREIARALEDLAHHQDEVARKMEQDPKNGANPQREQSLRQELEELLNKNPELNDQQDRQLAERTEQLVQKIEQQERQEKQMDDAVTRQVPLKTAEEKAESLAQKQEELNKEIANFEKKDQPEVKATNSPEPPQQRQDQIVQQLEKDKPNEAYNNQQQSANELNQAAQQMTRTAQDGQPVQNERQAKQDEQRAEAIKKQAQADAKELQKAEAKAAQNPKDQNAQNAVKQLDQQVQQLAQQAQQEAAEMQSRDPDQAQALEAAKHEAAQAQQDAQQNNGDKAEQEAQDAIAQIKAAAEKQEAADEQQKTQLADAGKEAAALAKEQQALAQQTAKAAQDLNQAQNQANPQGLAAQEQQDAQQADQAAGDAQQLAQAEQPNTPDAAQDAQQAQADLQQAAKAEQQVAQAAKDSQPQKAAEAQKAAEGALAKAEQALRGLPQDAAAQNPQGDRPKGYQAKPDQAKAAQANDAPPKADQPQDPNAPMADANANAQADGQNPDAKADGTPPASGDQPADANPADAQAAQANPADAQPGDPHSADAHQADAHPADQHSANAQQTDGHAADAQSAEAHQSGPHQSDAHQADAHAADAQSAEAQTAAAAQGEHHDGDPSDQSPGHHQGYPHAGSHPGNHGGQPAQAGAPHASPAQLAQEAARETQQARVAQDEATQNNAEAAHEAATALHQAARDLAQAIPALPPISPSNTPPDGDTSPGNQSPPGMAALDDVTPQDQADPTKGETGSHTSSNPNSRVKDGHGISLAGMRASDSRPPEVKALGVTPSDWAHLPPLAREQLLNAAQQGGAAGYQEMIKNYYSRIAKLQGGEK